jgi:2-amino-4-hydroxy-6-hydroxymethyldihydropteridine diphosphokinase
LRSKGEDKLENIAYLSIGSNVGNRLDFFERAIRLLNQDDNMYVEKWSSLYETEPVGYTNQATFLNAVIKIQTALTPEQLLVVCQNIEQQLGRKREIRWGPRTLDLDILLYNHENIETETLLIPHPRMQERAFVLVPLLELEPAIMLPTKDIPLADILGNLQDKEGVRLWKQRNGEDVSELFEN